MDYRQNILQNASSQIAALNSGINTTPGEIVADIDINVHDKMYKYAIERLKTEYSDLFANNECIITELSSGSVYDAPFVSIAVCKAGEQTDKPVSYLFSLEQWWPSAMRGRQACSINGDKFAGYSDWTNCECVYIDYINNTAEVKSKVYNWKRKMPLNVLLYINKDKTYIPMSEAISKMNTTSSFLYQHRRQATISGACPL